MAFYHLFHHGQEPVQVDTFLIDSAADLQALPDCLPGSVAHMSDYSLDYRKAPDGSWYGTDGSRVAPAGGPRLSALGLTGLNMHPAFSPATLDYATDIMTNVTQTTITAVPDDAAAIVNAAIIGVSALEFRGMSEEEQDAAMDEGTYLQWSFEDHTIPITWPSGKQNKCVVLAAFIPSASEGDAPVFGDFYAIDINWIQ